MERIAETAGRLIEGRNSNMSKPVINPTVRTPGQGRTVAVVGDVYRFLATGVDTNGTYALWEAIVPPGGGPPGGAGHAPDSDPAGRG
jgi:hypothetical protein